MTTYMSQSPLEHLCAELVRVPEVSEAHDVGRGLLVLDAEDGGDDLDLEAVTQEGALISVNLTEPCLQVLLGQCAEMLVEYLASECLVAVEVDDTVVTALGHCEELFLLRNLGILSMTCTFPFDFLFLHLFHHICKDNVNYIINF